MYNLSYFKESDPHVVIEFMRKNSFAMLIGCSADNKPVATQIPFFIDERDGKLFLSAHIMRKTDHHLALEHNPHALVVFSGAHTYVSASWYTDPQQASTWNYMSVHARGRVRFLDEPELLKMLERLTTHFENNPHSPASFHKLSSEYVNKLIKAIVAFEMEIEQMDNVFKLSQNRDNESQQNIVDKLKSRGDIDSVVIADEVQKRMPGK
jgi:transcriptional regulator